MKSLISIIVASVFFSFGDNPQPDHNSEPVAVVELFTSEGCSSCPAADRLMKEMIDLTRKEGKSVMGLAFHVTYWNYLGWKDPFSQEVFTDRQKQYGRIFALRSIYTPQAVFNGAEEFVGSDRVAFREAIEQAWQQPARYQIKATVNFENEKYHIAYSVNGKPDDEILNVAWVETYIENHVLRGENKDLTLKHYNVVRELQQTDLQSQGEIQMPVPADKSPRDGSIILFIQDRNSWKVLGTTKADLIVR